MSGQPPSALQQTENAGRGPFLSEGDTLGRTHRNVDKETYKTLYGECAASPHDEDKSVDDIQTEKSEEGESLAKHIKEDDKDKEIQTNTSMTAYSTCCLVEYKITVDLRETTAANGPQHVMDRMSRGSDSTEFKTWEAVGRKEAIAQSPILSKRWQNRFRFCSEGATLKRPGSGVVLQVPPGAIEAPTNISVYAAICTNDVYVKERLHLPSTETIVSPLAEFWAGDDFRFKKHVQVTLPTCLPSDYDVNRVHVYCITRDVPEGQLIVRKLERWGSLPQTADLTLEAYFHVNEKREVQVRTTHFSGYFCTYCGLCQNIPLEVYASPKHRNGSVEVSFEAYLWDKLPIPDNSEAPEAPEASRKIREIFQLTKMFKQAALHVELVLSRAETNMWRFEETPEQRHAFVLNWGNAKCENCSDEVMKYTDLGPFRPTWKLKSERREGGELPSTLDVILVISHVHTGDCVIENPKPTVRHFTIDVQSHTGGETSREHQTNGDVNTANESGGQDSCEPMEVSQGE